MANDQTAGIVTRNTGYLLDSLRAKGAAKAKIGSAIGAAPGVLGVGIFRQVQKAKEEKERKLLDETVKGASVSGDPKAVLAALTDIGPQITSPRVRNEYLNAIEGQRRNMKMLLDERAQTSLDEYRKFQMGEPGRKQLDEDAKGRAYQFGLQHPEATQIPEEFRAYQDAFDKGQDQGRIIAKQTEDRMRGETQAGLRARFLAGEELGPDLLASFDSEELNRLDTYRRRQQEDRANAELMSVLGAKPIEELTPEDFGKLTPETAKWAMREQRERKKEAGVSERFGIMQKSRDRLYELATMKFDLAVKSEDRQARAQAFREVQAVLDDSKDAYKSRYGGFDEETWSSENPNLAGVQRRLRERAVKDGIDLTMPGGESQGGGPDSSGTSTKDSLDAFIDGLTPEQIREIMSEKPSGRWEDDPEADRIAKDPNMTPQQKAEALKELKARYGR